MHFLHLFAHMDRNYVRKGDIVVKNTTPLGSIGTGNGQYYAHLHYSVSLGLTVEQLYQYIAKWPKERVQRYYRDPSGVDILGMFGKKMDVGNFGYGWLQWVGYGYHPGVDINGLGGGNTDFGVAFRSPVDGQVIHEWRGWTKNKGFGNVIIVAEKK